MISFVEFAQRAFRYIARFFVRKLGVSPGYFFYAVLKENSLNEYKNKNYKIKSEILLPPVSFVFRLPIGIETENQLPREKVFGGSFFDVRERKVSSAELIQVSKASIVSFYDQWNNEFSVAVDEDYSIIPIRGTGFHPAHSKLIRSGCNVEININIAWIFENWSGNYFHWIVYHLPKAILIKKKLPESKLLLPEKNNLDPIILASLRMIGYSDMDLVRQAGRYVTFDNLIFLSCDPFDPRLLEMVRQEFNPFEGDTFRRKIYISRKNAKWRRVVNEDEVIELLCLYGFESIEMENLSFEEQIQLMSETTVLVAPHGAGLTNMIFAPKGLKVLEFVLPIFPNSDYYSLANCLGHCYGLLLVDQVSFDKTPALQDMHISISALRNYLERHFQLRMVCTTPAKARVDA